jgi:hypothetical protein
MHELVGLGHRMPCDLGDSRKGETRTPEHIGISQAEQGNDTLVDALTCTVPQHRQQCLRQTRGMSHGVLLPSKQ